MKTEKAVQDGRYHITDFRWVETCERYYRKRGRLQRAYDRKHGTRSFMAQAQIPNRKLSGWDGEWFVLRNVDRELMRFKDRTLFRSDQWSPTP
jgi:hypothetical protein